MTLTSRFLRAALVRWSLLALALAGGARFTRAEILVADNVRLLAGAPQGPFVRTGDGAILGVDTEGVVRSRDEGRTWERQPVLAAGKFAARPERALLRTASGTLLWVWLNERERVFRWDDAQGGPLPGCRLPVYVVRSTDDGRTWSAPHQVQDGWCGAVRQLVQLPGGRIVLISQQAMAHPGRHVTLLHVSDDEGVSWQASAPIDLGAAGNYAGETAGLSAATHGGGIEGTAYVKANGDLRLLLRVPHGYFHELTSRDGLKWTASMPSPLEASDSPGMVVRLASGRLVLVWNRYRDPVRRTGRRDDLSIAFSANDGVTWTLPQVIARQTADGPARESARWLAYPYVFEPTPGRLWISTMQGGLRVELAEADFLSPGPRPLDGPSLRVVLLGDSITRGARPGVAPTQTMAALTQAGLRAAGLAAQVHSVGIGSERTDLALLRLERDVLSQRPDIVVVMYGTNDSWIDRGQSEVRLPAARYGENLRTLITRVQAAGAQVVVMTPPCFAEDNPRNGRGEDPNLRLAEHVEVGRQVAREMGVVLVDHFGAWREAQAGGRRLQAWTTDGCHPNADGHADLARRLLEALGPLARKLSPP